ncbi:MAG: MarC family protein [Bacteroidaceae bacterium]|nr:MarC family protein [Bacteroidaceae bacterium]
MISRLSWEQIASAFLVLFAIIDVLGSTPIFISLKERGRPINALKATLLSTVLLVAFYYAGDAALKFFNVDIQSFAVAGAVLIFIVALEMLLDIEIFKYSGPSKEATLIPVVFPLIAGAGAFTTLLSLKAEYASTNIMIGLALNMIFVYIVIRAADKINRYVSQNIIYVLRKFFGVILLAIAVRLFTTNLLTLINS